MAHLGVFDEDLVSRGATEQVSRNEAFSDDLVGYYFVVNSNVGAFESNYYPVYRLAVFDAGVTNHGEEQISLYEEFDEDLSSFPVSNSNISVMESLRPNASASAIIHYEIIQGLTVSKSSPSEAIASLAAAKTSAVEVIQYLSGSDSGLIGLFEDDMVDLTAEGEVNQKSSFDVDIPIVFVRGSNFESLAPVSGSVDLPIESLMLGTSAVSQTAGIVFESVQALQQSLDAIYEVALGYVSNSAETVFESLGLVTAPVAIPPFVLARLGVFDGDLAYLGADEQLEKSELFDEDLISPTRSTNTFVFSAGVFADELVSQDDDQDSVLACFDEDLLTLVVPDDVQSTAFESLSELTSSQDINLEALALITNSKVQQLSQTFDNILFGLFDEDIVDLTADGDLNQAALFDSDLPVISSLLALLTPTTIVVPSTGTGAADHLFNPAGGSNPPHGGSGNRGTVLRRRRRGQ